MQVTRITSTADSTVVKLLEYNPETSVLRVYFIKDDAIWDYQNIPAELYGKLVAAESVGAVFNTHIRGKYVAQKVFPLEKYV
jgi:hypothetical protein